MFNKSKLFDSIDKQKIKNIYILEDVVRVSYASVVWSHKIQEKQYDIYANTYKKLEFIKLIMVSLTSVGITSTLGVTSTLDINENIVKVLSLIASLITIFITKYQKSFNIENLLLSHKITANKLLEIREQYKILITRIKLKNESPDYLFSLYKVLVEKLQKIYYEAPSTSDKAVFLASKALKKSKDNTFNDSDIDMFLPPLLRRSYNE